MTANMKGILNSIPSHGKSANDYKLEAKMKKAVSVILSFIIVVSFTVPCFAQSGEKLNYLLLGDSIAKGSGILNSDEACFGRIVADTNGYSYVNRGIDGFTTADLDSYLDRREVIADVENADIISISIGGNDFLTKNVLNPLMTAITMTFGNSDMCRRTADKSYPLFCSVIEKIKSINPDAVILVQTIYNPKYPVLRYALNKIVQVLNENYTKYLEENPDSFVLVDVYKALENESFYTALDTIHPNAKGNVLIAREILKTLVSLGLGTQTEPVVNHQGVSEIAIPVYWIFKLLAR